MAPSEPDDEDAPTGSAFPGRDAPIDPPVSGRDAPIDPPVSGRDAPIDPPVPGRDAPIDVVATVGPLDVTVALLREFLHRSGAIRAVAVVDLAPGEGPAVVDVGRLLPVEVTAGGRTVHLPHAIPLDAVAPDVPEVTQLPPFEVSAAEGVITSPLGGLEHYAIAVRRLAELLGGRNVALATFATTDADAPLSITARQGDALVLALGEEEFEMDAGWPVDQRRTGGG